VISKQTKLSVLIATGLLLIMTGALSGCSDPKNEGSGMESPQERLTVPEKPPQKTVYNEEIYGDPDIFSEPRLQFVWQAPTEEKYTIWSTRLDGSDLRRVLPPDLLFTKGGVIFHLPMRSPDNRYLAVSLDSSEVMGTIKMLFDLKEKTATELGRGAYVPDFQWTSDSRFLYYYNDDGFWKYDVKSKINHDTPVIYSRGLYILDDDRFVALNDEGYSVYSKNGKKLFYTKIIEQNMGGIASNRHTISKDGSLMYCMIAYNKKPFNMILKLSNPSEVLFKSFDTNIANPAFGPKNRKLYFSKGVVRALDIKTGKTTRVFRLPGRPIGDLSIINTTNT